MSLHPSHCLRGAFLAPQAAPSPLGASVPTAWAYHMTMQSHATPDSPPAAQAHTGLFLGHSVAQQCQGPHVTGAARPCRLGIALIPAGAWGAAARPDPAPHGRSPGLQTGRGNAFAQPRCPIMGTGTPRCRGCSLLGNHLRDLPPLGTFRCKGCSFAGDTPSWETPHAGGCFFGGDTPSRVTPHPRGRSFAGDTPCQGMLLCSAHPIPGDVPVLGKPSLGGTPTVGAIPPSPAAPQPVVPGEGVHSRQSRATQLIT